MPQIILLGESVFDNLKYVQPEPDVAAQLRKTAPEGWKVSLRAVDGAVTDSVPHQLVDLPADATHLVLSVGGNDLLGCAGDMLRTPVTVSSEAFLLLARVVGVFESMYRRVVEACLKTGLPLVCGQSTYVIYAHCLRTLQIRSSPPQLVERTSRERSGEPYPPPRRTELQVRGD